MFVSGAKKTQFKFHARAGDVGSSPFFLLGCMQELLVTHNTLLKYTKWWKET
jgi:hypothetical protein